MNKVLVKDWLIYLFIYFFFVQIEYKNINIADFFSSLSSVSM